MDQFPALPAALAADALSVVIDPGRLGFRTTAEIDPVDQVPCQARALEAIRFGTGIRSPGFNLFLLGSHGTGRHSLVEAFLAAKAAAERDGDDWVYVENFDLPHKPRALRLPAGRGQDLADAMVEFTDDVRTSVPAFIANEENQNRLRSIHEEFKRKPDDLIEELGEKAATEKVMLVRTPLGFGFAPVEGEEIIKPDAFAKLPEAERQAIEAKIEDLQTRLQEIIKQIPAWERQRRDALRNAVAEMTEIAIKASMERVVGRFKDLPEVLDFLERVRADVVANFDSVEPPEDTAGDHGHHARNGRADSGNWLERYLVNCLVTGGPGRGAPIVHEANPTLANLVGRVEHMSEFGALMTNFRLIKGGALHRANGGYIVLDAEKLLREPFAWEALKRCLTQRSIRIESPGELLSLISTISLEPEPMPLDVKVVLIGSRLLYYLLTIYDPEFLELFKVEADFDEDVGRDAATEALFPGILASLARRKNLRPLTAGAVALVMQRAIRMAGDQQRISIHLRQLSDLLEEADHHAAAAGAAEVSAAHVQQAVDQQVRRADRIRERSYEMITRGKVLIDTEGTAVGRINGLSVLQLGDFAFGRPTRISARVRLGTGKVVDIEREVDLGGPLHSKGVLILSGFIAARYAADEPLSLAASLVFEQSYGGVEGDSASSAELYALLSAISEVPLRQDLAVTGSVNQYGEVQVIGGVNEKIEGFFDICQARGLTGSQGVLIPAGNADDLMLERRVIDAVAAGRFHVYPVRSVDEGLALLTGMPAGAPDGEGHFPEGTVNGLVERRLRAFARARRRLREETRGDADKEAETP